MYIWFNQQVGARFSLPLTCRFRGSLNGRTSNRRKNQTPSTKLLKMRSVKNWLTKSSHFTPPPISRYRISIRPIWYWIDWFVIRLRFDYVYVSTPTAYECYLNAHRGTGYGLDHIRQRFDVHQSSLLRSDSGFDGILLTGFLLYVK